MSTEAEYQDLEETWDDEDDTIDEPDTDDELELDDDELESEILPLDKSVSHKDARRRLDDMLEERRLRAEMADDF
ncbi:MAG TPA: hypothetical protein VK979_08605 [Guyparkeria sp.]|nr:hypothetical protein [Guyparkeria sp.]HZJ81161.1 hypothetical protein [Guyparkeria sp.]